MRGAGAAVFGCDLDEASSAETVSLVTEADGVMAAMAPLNLMRNGPLMDLSDEDRRSTIANEPDIVVLGSRGLARAGQAGRRLDHRVASIAARLEGDTAADSRQVRVLGISGGGTTAEIDGGCQRARCQHLSAARWFGADQRSEFAVGIKRGIAKSCEVAAGRFDPALDLAELSFAVVHNMSELSKAEASGKTLSREFLAKQTRFVIHLVTIRRCLLGSRGQRL